MHAARLSSLGEAAVCRDRGCPRGSPGEGSAIAEIMGSGAARACRLPMISPLSDVDTSSNIRSCTQKRTGCRGLQNERSRRDVDHGSGPAFWNWNVTRSLEAHFRCRAVSYASHEKHLLSGCAHATYWSTSCLRSVRRASLFHVLDMRLAAPGRRLALEAKPSGRGVSRKIRSCRSRCIDAVTTGVKSMVSRCSYAPCVGSLASTASTSMASSKLVNVSVNAVSVGHGVLPYVWPQAIEP